MKSKLANFALLLPSKKIPRQRSTKKRPTAVLKKCADRGSKNANVGQLNRRQIGLFSEPLSAQILTDYEPLLVIIRVDKSVFF